MTIFVICVGSSLLSKATDVTMGTEYETYQAYLQALIDPDREADFATVIGLRILTQVNISIPIPLQS